MKQSAGSPLTCGTGPMFAGLLTLFLPVALAAQNTPVIQISAIPDVGAPTGFITGRVLNADPAKVSVVILDFTPGLGTSLRPFCSPSTLVSLKSDGSFSAPIPAVDNFATQFTVVAVPASAAVPCYGLNTAFPSTPGIPPALASLALSTAVVSRSLPGVREIVFSGRSWYTKANPVLVGPGPNFFAGGPNNVFVDSQDRLHLRIVNAGGYYYCPELISQDTFLNGTFRFTLETAPFTDAAPVFGAFLYADGEADTHEIDMLEFGGFNLGDNHNADYAVQPATPSKILRWTAPAATPTIHTMKWQANSLSFQSSAADGTTLQSWTYPGTPPQADIPGIRFHFNEWLFRTAPLGAEPAEVIVSHFSWQPPAASAAPAVSAVRNAGDGGTGISRGAAAALYGSNLAAATQQASSVPLPLSLANVTVTIGGIPVPLFFVSPGQINFEIPADAPLGDALLRVSSGTSASQVFPFVIAPAAPAAYLYNGHCLAQNQNGSINSASTPAYPGEFLTLYLASLGDVDNLVPTGTGPPLSPLSRTIASVFAFVGPFTVKPQFAGLAPSLPGVGQLNIQVPSFTTGVTDIEFAVGGVADMPCSAFIAGFSTNIAPVLQTVNPPAGPASGYPLVVLTGTSFSSGARVNFGSVPAASVTFVSSQRILAAAPPGTGTVAVSVINPDNQTSVLLNAFAYQPTPTVTAIQPSQGTNTGGTTFTLQGTGFAPGVQVTLGGARATSVTVTSATSLTAVIPAYAGTGVVDVVVMNDDGGKATFARGFTFIAPPLTTITSVSQPFGVPQGGTHVTITGTNFQPGVQVLFGSTPATSVVVQSTTTILAVTPPNLPGSFAVTINNLDGTTATLANAFTYGYGPIELFGQIQSCQVSGTTLIPVPSVIYLFAQTDQYYVQPCSFSAPINISPAGNWGPVATHSGTIYAILVRSGYTLPPVLQSLPFVDSINVFAVSKIGVANSCTVAQCP